MGVVVVSNSDERTFTVVRLLSGTSFSLSGD